MADDGPVLQPLTTHDFDRAVGVTSAEAHDILDPTATYTLIRYEEYETREACGVCHRSRQASKRVVIRNERTGDEFPCGLDCLFRHFGVSVRDLEHDVSAPKRLVTAWQHFVRPRLTGSIAFRGTRHALEFIHEFVVPASHFPCPAAHEVSRKARQMRDDIQGLSVGTYDASIDVMIAFFHLQFEFGHDREAWEARRHALRHHPNLTTGDGPAFNAFYDDPTSLTWSSLAKLLQLLERLNKRKPSLRIQEQPPYAFPTIMAYLSGLRATAQRRVDLPPLESPRVALEAFRLEWPRLLREVRRGGRRVILLTGTDGAALASARLPAYLRAEAQEVGGDLIVSDVVHTHRPATVSAPLTSLAAMQREHQQVEVAERKPGEPSPVHYRGCVLYVPDRWHEAYGVWFRAGGVKEGRSQTERLLGPPRQHRAARA